MLGFHGLSVTPINALDNLFFGEVSEILAASEAQASILNAAGTQVEVLVVAETTDATVVLATAVVETLSATAETVNAQLVTSGARAEALTVADIPTSLGIFPSDVAEAVTISDIHDASVGGVPVTIDESLSAMDTCGATIIAGATVSELLSVVETQTGALHISSDRAEVMNAAETIDAGQTFTSAVIESLTVQDTITAFVPGAGNNARTYAFIVG